jgi:hypothetical protein
MFPEALETRFETREQRPKTVFACRLDAPADGFGALPHDANDWDIDARKDIGGRP